VRQFIDDLRSAVEPEDESLDAETLESLGRGLADVAAGRVMPRPYKTRSGRALAGRRGVRSGSTSRIE